MFRGLDDLLSRIKEEVHRLQRRNQLKVSTSETSFEGEMNHPTTDSTSLTNLPGHTATASTKQNLLTIKQVNMICARFLKEREEKIREEYDQILSNKLAGKRTEKFPPKFHLDFFQNNTKVSFDLLKIS